jgi:hypothetical protein
LKILTLLLISIIISLFATALVIYFWAHGRLMRWRTATDGLTLLQHVAWGWWSAVLCIYEFGHVNHELDLADFVWLCGRRYELSWCNPVKPGNIYLWREVVCLFSLYLWDSPKPGCFRSRSWSLWKALKEQGCICFGFMAFGLAV